MDGGGGAPVRSRTSQSPSPSHSTASASSSAHLLKRTKFPPPPLDDDGNDTEEPFEDEDTEEPFEDDEADEDSSMRTFTASRLSEVKAEAGTAGGEGASAGPAAASGGQGQSGAHAAAVGAGGGLIAGIVVKDDPAKGIFTENIQTSGAYSAREEGLKREVSKYTG